MNTVTYGGLTFPCSRAGTKPPASRFSATRIINMSSLTDLVGIGRPADEEVRRQWMRRFLADMHWFPLIEALSGCNAATDPSAHAEFMARLAARDVLRVAHRPWGKRERLAWAFHVRDRVTVLCRSPAARTAVRPAIMSLQGSEADVLFVASDAIAIAEATRPACLFDPSWLFHKAVTVVKGRLTEDEHRAMLLHGLGNDPSAEAYCRFVTDGSL